MIAEGKNIELIVDNYPADHLTEWQEAAELIFLSPNTIAKL